MGGEGSLLLDLAQANLSGPWQPMLLALLAALALCAVIAWIWRREARKPYASGDDYPHENGDGEGW